MNDTNTFSLSGNNTNGNTLTIIPTWQPQQLAMVDHYQKKCKCPNPKHTNGCSIEPESEYCVWCAKGCVKRVQAIHVKYT